MIISAHFASRIGGGETFKKDPKLNQFMYRKRNTNNPHVLIS